jgi:putative transposase
VEQPVTEAELQLMKTIDEVYLRRPFFGSRSMTDELRSLGHRINRKHVQRLMRVMGLESLAPKPDLSRSHPEHKKYPYLLRNLEVTRANQVWATDITYIPLAHGFMYLVAIIDWHSRAVLSWRLSNTLDVSFCVDALEAALAKYGQPEIFNSDQGVQFTSEAFTSVLLKRGIAISMDGKGRCIDNVFVERLWRSLKYEDIYLHVYGSAAEALRGISLYFEYFNESRRHSSLGKAFPMAVYRNSVTVQGACAPASPSLRHDTQLQLLSGRQSQRGEEKAA